MAKIARSARGEVVDFDVLSIKEALSSTPISLGTTERRSFIDQKNGLKPKIVSEPVSTLKPISEPTIDLASEALKVSLEAAAAAQEVSE